MSSVLCVVSVCSSFGVLVRVRRIVAVLPESALPCRVMKEAVQAYSFGEGLAHGRWCTAARRAINTYSLCCSECLPHPLLDAVGSLVHVCVCSFLSAGENSFLRKGCGTVFAFASLSIP